MVYYKMNLILFSSIITYYYRIASSISLSAIPSTGTPPEKASGVGSAYYETRNQILVFGGYKSDTKKYSSKLHSFNLTNLEWELILPGSNAMPPGLAFGKTIVHSDIFYVFYGKKYEGVSSDIFTFNLITFVWDITKLQGDIFPGRSNFAFTSFSYMDIDHVAIFGGLWYNGINNELFM